jgi:hypothetical protein
MTRKVLCFVTSNGAKTEIYGQRNFKGAKRDLSNISVKIRRTGTLADLPKSYCSVVGNHAHRRRAKTKKRRSIDTQRGPTRNRVYLCRLPAFEAFGRSTSATRCYVPVRTSPNSFCKILVPRRQENHVKRCFGWRAGHERKPQNPFAASPRRSLPSWLKKMTGCWVQFQNSRLSASPMGSRFMLLP